MHCNTNYSIAQWSQCYSMTNAYTNAFVHCFILCKKGDNIIGYINESVIYNIYPLGLPPEHQEKWFQTGIQTWQNLRLDWPYEVNVGKRAVFNLFLKVQNTAMILLIIKESTVGSLNESFKKICKTLHDNGIKIMLDGVFNRSKEEISLPSKMFSRTVKIQDVVLVWKFKLWNNSPYNDGFSYEGWAGYYDLVKLNLWPRRSSKLSSWCLRFWIDEFEVLTDFALTATALTLNFQGKNV